MVKAGRMRTTHESQRAQNIGAALGMGRDSKYNWSRFRHGEIEAAALRGRYVNRYMFSSASHSFGGPATRRKVHSSTYIGELRCARVQCQSSVPELRRSRRNRHMARSQTAGLWATGKSRSVHMLALCRGSMLVLCSCATEETANGSLQRQPTSANVLTLTRASARYPTFAIVPPLPSPSLFAHSLSPLRSCCRLSRGNYVLC